MPAWRSLRMARPGTFATARGMGRYQAASPRKAPSTHSSSSSSAPAPASSRLVRTVLCFVLAGALTLRAHVSDGLVPYTSTCSQQAVVGVPVVILHEVSLPVDLFALVNSLVLTRVPSFTPVDVLAEPCWRPNIP